jgi:hypothetical protein
MSFLRHTQGTIQDGGLDIGEEIVRICFSIDNDSHHDFVCDHIPTQTSDTSGLGTQHLGQPSYADVVMAYYWNGHQRMGGHT